MDCGIGMRGIAREVNVRSTRGCVASHEATLQALAHCRSMRRASVLMPRIGQITFERSHDGTDGARKASRSAS